MKLKAMAIMNATKPRTILKKNLKTSHNNLICLVLIFHPRFRMGIGSISNIQIYKI